MFQNEETGNNWRSSESRNCGRNVLYDVVKPGGKTRHRHGLKRLVGGHSNRGRPRESDTYVLLRILYVLLTLGFLYN